MAWKKNDTYYMARQVEGFGLVCRSLKTTRKDTAIRREGAVLALHDAGKDWLIREWLRGETSIEELYRINRDGKEQRAVAEIEDSEVPTLTKPEII